jgi:hypothetical protein
MPPVQSPNPPHYHNNCRAALLQCNITRLTVGLFRPVRVVAYRVKSNFYLIDVSDLCFVITRILRRV